MRVGLTGGIASGKSTVADYLSRYGAPVIDTDHLARALVQPGSPTLQAICATFGNSLLQADGQLDRAALGALVFNDFEARRKLEAIVHPRVEERVLQRLARIDAPYTVVVVPLLFESGMDRLMEWVVAIDLAEEEQEQRIIARDGLSKEQARARIASQLKRSVRSARADCLIDNHGPPAALAQRVLRLHCDLLNRAQRKRRDCTAL
ncbi:dephospho-CoA kinase [Halorhodospira abdelmalekii]|nr:dephospho-CoA kinase [Halorhodospira abdelmalekii]